MRKCDTIEQFLSLECLVESHCYAYAKRNDLLY